MAQSGNTSFHTSVRKGAKTSNVELVVWFSVVQYQKDTFVQYPPVPLPRNSTQSNRNKASPLRAHRRTPTKNTMTDLEKIHEACIKLHTERGAFVQWDESFFRRLDEYLFAPSGDPFVVVVGVRGRAHARRGR